MKITLKQLRSLGACDEQVYLFEKLFGAEVELTEALILEYGGQFNLSWLAMKLFKGDIRAEYQKSCELISAEHQKALGPTLAEYQKARALAFWACVLKMEEVK
jgi:hypothetical protein